MELISGRRVAGEPDKAYKELVEIVAASPSTKQRPAPLTRCRAQLFGLNAGALSTGVSTCAWLAFDMWISNAPWLALVFWASNHGWLAMLSGLSFACWLAGLAWVSAMNWLAWLFWVSNHLWLALASWVSGPLLARFINEVFYLRLARLLCVDL